MLLRRLAPFLWMIALYIATVVGVFFDPLPLAPPVLEARNIIIHAAAYAVQAVLIGRALAGTGINLNQHRVTFVVIGAALALGIGQEALQTALRQQAFIANSLLDLAVDAGGAALGLWLLRRREAGFQQQEPSR